MKIQRGEKKVPRLPFVYQKGGKAKCLLCKDKQETSSSSAKTKDQAEGQRSSMLKVTSQTFCILPNLITISICFVLTIWNHKWIFWLVLCCSITDWNQNNFIDFHWNHYLKITAFSLHWFKSSSCVPLAWAVNLCCSLLFCDCCCEYVQHSLSHHFKFQNKSP